MDGAGGRTITTIAYRDGVLAADTSITIGGVYSIGGAVTKAVRLDASGDIAAAAGNAGYCHSFLQWALGAFQGAWPKPAEEDAKYDIGLIFKVDHSVIIYELAGWYPVKPPYYASGSGKEIAIGAFFMGADAETAVKAAIEHDTATRGPITIIRHAS